MTAGQYALTLVFAIPAGAVWAIVNARADELELSDWQANQAGRIIILLSMLEWPLLAAAYFYW